MNEAAKPVPRARKEIKLTPADERRFWAKVNKDGPTQPHMDSSCWEWIANYGNHGYGQFRVGNKINCAHRVVWVLHHGSVPQDGSYHGICVCHRCDYRLCVNPSHLFLGTQQKNITDRDSKGRCARGEAQGSAKLTEDQVATIRALYASRCLTQTQLGERFAVGQPTISRIVNRTSKRRHWTHI